MGGGSELSKAAAQKVAVLLPGINGEQSGWEDNTGAVGKPVGYSWAEGDGQFPAGTPNVGQERTPGAPIPCRQGE